MPAERFTKKADTAKRRRMWQHVEDSMLKRGASRGAAVRAANAAVKRSYQRSHRRGRR